MRVCYFGTYKKNYSRNRILVKGLRKNGVKVIECHVPVYQTNRVCLKFFLFYILHQFIIYLKLLFKFLKLRGWKCDAIIMGALGRNNLNVPLMWLISRILRKPLLFDCFISVYDTFVFDRKTINKKSFKAKLYYLIDKLSCMLSDIVIVDTYTHLRYFNKEFKIPKNKFRVIYIGADDEIFLPKERHYKKREQKFTVEFHGTFIPLQGIQYIIKASKILEKKNIMFVLIGKGQTYRECIRISKRLGVKNVLFLGHINQENIPTYIANADVCLGIFGNTKKASRVIPNKVYETLAMKKPLVTGDSPAAREVLTNNENALLCEMANPKALARSILILKKNKNLKNKIAENGYKLYKKKFTPKKLGAELKRIVIDICK